MDGREPTALDIADRIRRGETTAVAVTEDALTRIAARNGRLGAYTDVLADRARVRAFGVDLMRSEGQALPALAGVPFAVKNLFDIAGVVTRAGSTINRSNPPAVRDATVIERLEAAGAILTGACTMDEYAYGFTGENVHEGPSRNPHDVTRMTGGSSGGPAAAVAGGLVPLAIGSDTNGSIRVPASLCGLYGLKPTYGRISRAGAFPFVASLDTVGPFARSLDDLVAVYEQLQGPDPRDPVSRAAPHRSSGVHSEAGTDGLRVALAGDYFLKGADPAALSALHVAALELAVTREVVLPEAHRARAAAFVITAAEGGALHRERLRSRAADFDPDTRDRLIAGAMLPAAWAIQAQRFRRWFHREVMAVFETVDVILALATPITAPTLGQKTFMFEGAEMPVRAHLGIYTQPLSFIGLPVVTVPLKRAAGEMPIGVQVIAAPWNEAAALRVARDMDRRGLTAT
jgi:aspartyl-tRNA(Asn)/glutamyl-tRNA(Gln) amidotransferase subunit A